jgi:hypothetical protein
MAAHSHNRTRESPVRMLTGSCQLVEQRLSVPEVGGLEAIGEPVVDRREDVAGLSRSLLRLHQGRVAIVTSSAMVGLSAVGMVKLLPNLLVETSPVTRSISVTVTKSPRSPFWTRSKSRNR